MSHLKCMIGQKNCITGHKTLYQFTENLRKSPAIHKTRLTTQITIYLQQIIIYLIL